MQKIMDIIVPKVSIDDALFAKAPNETLRMFVRQLQTRLARLEVIMITSLVFPYLPFELLY